MQIVFIVMPENAKLGDGAANRQEKTPESRRHRVAASLQCAYALSVVRACVRVGLELELEPWLPAIPRRPHRMTPITTHTLPRAHTHPIPAAALSLQMLASANGPIGLIPRRIWPSSAKYEAPASYEVASGRLEP
jgi:hypothetical protein